MSELFAPPSPSAKDAPAYRVLARKYRPSTFAELVGQEAMVRTLTNAIATKRLPQAWMLTGVRGIGKTTTARIIARALNCTGKDGKGGPTIEPCGVCDACRAITEDRHVDVLEMDAASRTGVDDIRDIIDGVRYGPVSARYKIYILDEVHMLSKNAFNALLKTLEEPPPHTKFIFATTEIRKVPVTVLSRCQRFDLRRIESDVLAPFFADIAAKEKVKAEEEALRLIAHAADGSVRDGLSLLDQAIARGGNKITADDVKDMLGLADRSHSLALAQQLLRGHVADALKTFTAMQQAGADPLQTLQDLCEMVHMLTRAQVIADYAQSADVSEIERGMLTELADIKIPALSRAWQILHKGVGEVQNAPHPSQAAEMVLIRMAYAAELPPPGDLIKQLQDKINSASASEVSAAPPSGAPRATQSHGNTVMFAQPQSAVVRAVPQAVPQDAAPMPQDFREIVALFEEQREGVLVALLRKDVHPVRCEAGVLEMRVGRTAPKDFVNRVNMALNKWTGRRWMVSVSDAEGAPTLAEEEAAVEQKRRERIQAHPLMQATQRIFPSAKIIDIKQKTVISSASVAEESESAAVEPVETED